MTTRTAAMRAICLTIAALPLVGCGGPQVPEEELGDIEFELPDLRDIPRQDEGAAADTADASADDAEAAFPADAPSAAAAPAEGPQQEESGNTPPTAAPPAE